MNSNRTALIVLFSTFATAMGFVYLFVLAVTQNHWVYVVLLMFALFLQTATGFSTFRRASRAIDYLVVQQIERQQNGEKRKRVPKKRAIAVGSVIVPKGSMLFYVSLSNHCSVIVTHHEGELRWVPSEWRLKAIDEIVHPLYVRDIIRDDRNAIYFILADQWRGDRIWIATTSLDFFEPITQWETAGTEEV